MHRLIGDFARNKEAMPIIVEGAIPWNYLNYPMAKKNAEKVYTNAFCGQSGLINGTQWDTVMKFIQVKSEKDVSGNIGSIDDWGNYKNVLISSLNRFPQLLKNDGTRWDEGDIKKKNDVFLLRTGASTQTQVLNISDIAGNLNEWTSEIYFINDISCRVKRGGMYSGYGYDYGPTSRVHVDTWNRFSDITFRVVIYIK